MSYTTEQAYPQSPYQSYLFDEELREYEMYYGGDKVKWSETLLDEYGGTKFNFDLEWGITLLTSKLIFQLLFILS